MSDANKQSVERCKYRHDWTINPELGAERYIVCRQCRVRPTAKQMQEAEAIVYLRSVLKPGDTVYTVLRHVSRSGMSRGIDFYLIRDSEPLWITSYVGHAIDSPQSEKDWRESRGLRVNGCGMDMGFHCVYSLSRVLFPDGAQGASEHAERDGGYALNHRWL